MESHCLRRLGSSPFVAALVQEFNTEFQWFGILEFCEGGELWAHVRQCGCVAEGEAACLAKQMTEALAYVHDAGIVHRDVKCENFLLSGSPSPRVKIIDFGASRDTQSPGVAPMILGPGYEHHVGTPNFMAPEAINSKGNDRLSDLWSLGAAFSQLFVGEPPFRAATPFLVLQKASRGNPWFPSAAPTAEKDLVQKLLRVEGPQRLGATSTRELLSHEFFRAASDELRLDTPDWRLLQLSGRTAAARTESAITELQKQAQLPANQGPLAEVIKQVCLETVAAEDLPNFAERLLAGLELKPQSFPSTSIHVVSAKRFAELRITLRQEETEVAVLDEHSSEEERDEDTKQAQRCCLLT